MTRSKVSTWGGGGNALLLSSKVKQTNIVNVLSTMHHSEQDLRQDGSAKPDVIKFYNHTKGGVDRADQMCSLYSVDLYSVDLYSTKSYSRRWPLQVFCNVLDVAGINAHTIYKIANGSSQSSRMFLLDLVNELVAPLCARAAASQSLAAYAPVLAKRVKCSRCKTNLTAKCCNKCAKPVCGKCTSPMHVCAKC